MGDAIHMAAAYAIGLRGLSRYKNKDMEPPIPDRYRNLLEKPPEDADTFAINLFHWKTLRQKLTKIRTHMFYRDIPACKNKTELENWIKEEDIQMKK